MLLVATLAVIELIVSIAKLPTLEFASLQQQPQQGNRTAYYLPNWTADGTSSAYMYCQIQAYFLDVFMLQGTFTVLTVSHAHLDLCSGALERVHRAQPPSVGRLPRLGREVTVAVLVLLLRDVRLLRRLGDLRRATRLVPPRQPRDNVSLWVFPLLLLDEVPQLHPLPLRSVRHSNAPLHGRRRRQSAPRRRNARPPVCPGFILPSVSHLLLLVWFRLSMVPSVADPVVTRIQRTLLLYVFGFLCLYTLPTIYRGTSHMCPRINQTMLVSFSCKTSRGSDHGRQ
jgi:hypothetical protein